MFNFFAKLLKKEGLQKYQQELANRNPYLNSSIGTTEYYYDPEKERLYHEFVTQNNEYDTEEVVIDQSLDQHLKEKLSHELRRDKKRIRNEILSKDSDSTLSVYLRDLERQINILIKRYHRNNKELNSVSKKTPPITKI